MKIAKQYLCVRCADECFFFTAAIFKGKYGSDKENKLEAEHDYLTDRLQRIGAARYKWSNGRNLLNHATSQLCVGCKKWMEILNMDPA